MHATGAGWREGDGITIQKRDVTASKWVKSLSMPRRTTTAVLHTRWWTQGHPTVNDNNHPIRSGSVVGVHNGTVWNDTWLFNQMAEAPRIGEVDSEAIFALLAYGHDYYKADHDTDLLEHVEGNAAIAYMDVNDPEGVLHVARLAGSPLIVAQSTAGSFVAGSTKDAVVDAMNAVNLTIGFLEEVPEGTYLRVDGGLIIEERTFEVDQFASWKRGQPAKKATPVPATYLSAGSVLSVTDWCDECDQWKPDGCTCDKAVYGDPEPEVRELFPVDDLHNALIEAVVLDVNHVVQPVEEKDWDQRYSRRIEDVCDWYEAALGFYDGDLAEANIAAYNVCANVRPGDWVSTELLGQECHGQVLECSQTFPSGYYLLRVLVSKDPHAFEGMEVVVLKRKADQFRPVSVNGHRTPLDRVLGGDNTLADALA